MPAAGTNQSLHARPAKPSSDEHEAMVPFTVGTRLGAKLGVAMLRHQILKGMTSVTRLQTSPGPVLFRPAEARRGGGLSHSPRGCDDWAPDGMRLADTLL